MSEHDYDDLITLTDAYGTKIRISRWETIRALGVALVQDQQRRAEDVCGRHQTAKLPGMTLGPNDLEARLSIVPVSRLRA